MQWIETEHYNKKSHSSKYKIMSNRIYIVYRNQGLFRRIYQINLKF